MGDGGPSCPCVACPELMDQCANNTPQVVKAGYFLSDSDFPEALPCPLSQSSCEGNNTCAEGYEGFACSICQEGFTRQGPDCVKCAEGSSIIVIFTTVLVVYA